MRENCKAMKNHIDPFESEEDRNLREAINNELKNADELIKRSKIFKKMNDYFNGDKNLSFKDSIEKHINPLNNKLSKNNIQKDADKRMN